MNKRTLTYIAIAVILGAALALAFAVSRGDSAATAMGDYGAQVQSDQSVAGDTGVYAGDTGDPLAADPARAHPPLDKFTSKDPFLPLGTVNTGTGGSGSVSNATIKINGTQYGVSVGDQVPPNDPVFKIQSITSSDVTFALISGTFSDGSSSVSVNVGESVKVTDEGTGESYTLTVVSVGSGGGGTAGHTITVLSVNEQDGVAVCTLEVDGKTYSDLEVGDTIDTSWGEIKIVAINVGNQTVTIMHGDQTLTLRAGQVVVK